MSDIAFTNKLAIGAEGLQSILPARTRVLGLLDQSVFVSLLVLIVLVAIPYGTVEPWWTSLYECAVFGLGTVWIVEGLISGSWNITARRLLAPVAAFTAFVFLQGVGLPVLSGTISVDPYETRLTFFKLLALLINAALLVRYTSTSRRLRALIHVVIAVAVASAVFGIVRQALQHNETGFVLPYLHRTSGFGQFINKNHFALLIEMAAGLAMAVVCGGAVRRERLLFYISAMALMWTALVMTNSRGGLFSMFGQIVFLIVMLVWVRSRQRNAALPPGRRTWRRMAAAFALSACLLAVVGVSAVWIGGNVMVTRLESLPGEIKAEAQDPRAGGRRRDIWGATWQLIEAHPLVGSGFGAYTVAITRFHDASGKWIPEAAHNDYLELLASGGVFGVVMAIWFGFVLIKSARRQLATSDIFRRAACLGALTGLFGVAAHSVVDFGLHVTANAVIFLALVVIAARDLREAT